METQTSARSDTTLGDQLPVDVRTPAQDAAGHEFADAVLDAIQALPDDQRTATILFEYDRRRAWLLALPGYMTMG